MLAATHSYFIAARELFRAGPGLGLTGLPDSSTIATSTLGATEYVSLAPAAGRASGEQRASVWSPDSDEEAGARPSPRPAGRFRGRRFFGFSNP